MRPTNTQLRQIEELSGRLLTRQGADRLIRALLYLDGERGAQGVHRQWYLSDDPLVIALEPHVTTSLTARLLAPPATTVTLGGFIKANRLVLSMSQGELAELVGVRTGTVCTWELDQYRPQPRMIPRLAAALEVSEDELRALRAAA